MLWNGAYSLRWPLPASSCLQCCNSMAYQLIERGDAMTKAEIVRAWCEQRVGCPYIYGGTGQPCTPEYREARMKQYPAYAEKIKRNCKVLSGKSNACYNCRWCDPETDKGKPAYDCAQLSRRAMEAVGIPMVSGANSQWERTKWEESGTMGYLPREKVCLVFRWDDDHMGHVGVYQGDGTVIHAKGHDYGVVRQNISDTKFTHWGVPAGLYEEDGDVAINHPILHRGDSGESVAYLQTLLCDVGEMLTVDGKFGDKTEKAVKEFQRKNGLKIDGVVGSETWAALENATGHEDSQPSEPPDAGAGDINVPGNTDTVTIARDDWNAIRAAASVLIQAVKKYEGSDSNE